MKGDCEKCGHKACRKISDLAFEDNDIVVKCTCCGYEYEIDPVEFGNKGKGRKVSIFTQQESIDVLQ